MPSKKVENIDLRTNKPGLKEYPILYDGHRNKDNLKVAEFEEEKNILNARISGLKCRNTVLIVSVILILFISLVPMVLFVINQMNDSKHEVQFQSLKREVYRRSKVRNIW